MDAAQKLDTVVWTPPGMPKQVVNTTAAKTKDYTGTAYPLYGGDVTMEFYDRLGRASHVYLVDGQRVTSVSTITNLATPHEVLMWWAVGESRDYMKARLKMGTVYSREQIDSMIEGARKAHNVKKEDAATVGTQAHAWIAEYIAARIDGRDVNASMPDDDRGSFAVAAFLDWEQEHNVFWLSTERPVYSRQLNYCGTMDWEAYVDGKLTAGDLKTSKAIREGYYLQLAAYAQAREEEEGRPIYQDRIILHIEKEPDADGKPQFEARSIGAGQEQGADFQAFRGLLIAYRRLKEIVLK